ncbi:MAG: GNAT family N-acetyltransferase [Clostridiales bacterium]|nr:GNAT family N-acetyltransferase [Clostridiales bacterium]
MPNITIRAYTPDDLPAMIAIWNQVVEDGVAFPQLDFLDDVTGPRFFSAQTHCAVAVESGRVIGLYILHPNNEGRCGHICNASYAVDRECRGKGAGRLLVTDCLKQGRNHGFSILQFNAVVASNTRARSLYQSLGFVQLGVIPGGFLMKDGHYEDIIPYYHLL